jgi:hypothetical protein
MARMKLIEPVLPQKEAKAAGLNPGDRGYQKFCINWVEQEISKYYEGTGLQPPVTATVQRWFYADELPDWVAVFLLNLAKNN